MTDPLKQPTSLLGAPCDARRPVAQPARVVEAYRTGIEPLLTVRRVARLDGRVNDEATLTQALLRAIPHLKPGAPVDIVAPTRRGGHWHLDTRPTATRRLPVVGVARFRTARIGPDHYLIPGIVAVPGQFGGTTGTAGYRNALTFRLGPEVRETVCGNDEAGKPVCLERGTGYFQLIPCR